MSLHPNPNFAIPDEPRRVAQAAFPKGLLGLSLADACGALDHDDQFTTRFPDRGQPTTSPARLALAAVLHEVEGVSDRPAADAVRRRIDWQYALALELTDPGFDQTVLREFRSRWVGGRREPRLLDPLLDRCRELGLITERGRQRTDATHVVAAVRGLNRLERVGEPRRAAWNDWAVVAPDGLPALAPLEWYQRSGRRVANYHLPTTDSARHAWAQRSAAEGEQLLAAIDAVTDQPWLAQLPAVVLVRRMWAEQDTGAPDQLRWRAVQARPAPADLISAPYDTEVRYSTKRDLNWGGSKGPLTATWETELPHWIVNVETTPATTPDDHLIAVVHESLAERALLPGEPLVDQGSTEAGVLGESPRDYGVTVVGPVADDPRWQAHAGEGFAQGGFVVDWEQHVVTCPAGKASLSWLPHPYPQNGMIFEARFSRADGTPCPLRPPWTKAKNEPGIIGLQSRAEDEALQAARRRQTTDAFRSQYAARAGIESTHAQAIRRCGFRSWRYIGLAKTPLQPLLTATASTVLRLHDWGAGTPPAQPRCSRFAALQPAA